MTTIKKHPEHNVYVSPDGRVFKELKTTECAVKNKIPYDRVHIGTVEGKPQRPMVHRLVAQTYLDNPENKPCVCHKDDNPQNNHVDNLWWGTHKENMQDMVTKGRARRGPHAKTLRQWEHIFALRHEGLTLDQIGDRIGVSGSRVSQIIKSMSSGDYRVC